MASPDDDIRELRIQDRELREGIEEATAQLERAKRRLDDVALEFMHRGDVVRVAVGQRAWTGVIVHVANRLLSLTMQGGTTIDVDLDQLTTLAVVSRSPTGGRSPGRADPASLIARLRELEGTDVVVDVGGRDFESLGARVRIVAQTHVEVEAIDGVEWVIPLASIAYVVTES